MIRILHRVFMKKADTLMRGDVCIPRMGDFQGMGKKGWLEIGD